MSFWDKIKSEFAKGDSAVRQIIMVNLAVFVFTIFVGVVARVSGFQQGELLEYFYLPSNLSTLIIRPWTLVTNIFFHAGFWHIAGNLILLYFLGGILEEFLDNRKIWQLFFFGGLVGGLLYLFSYNVFPVFSDVVSTTKLLGASGGVTAIIVACGVHLPYYNVRPFGLFNVQLRWVALFFVFRDLYLFPGTENIGGIFAHLGGALFGLLFILDLQGKINLPKLGNFAKQKPKLFKIKPDEREIKQAKVTKDYAKPNQDEIDAILDKISHSGYDSLTSDEKALLFKASE